MTSFHVSRLLAVFVVPSKTLIMNAPLDVTIEALNAFKTKLQFRNTPETMIRFGVRGGACSGYSYAIEFDDNDLRTGDISWQADGVNFVIDKKSMLYLTGSRVVWKQSLLQTGFDFENPHEASRCGCGGSFAPK